MNQRIAILLAMIAAAAAGTSWFVHRQRLRDLNSGEVYVREQSPAPVAPRTAVPPPIAPASAPTPTTPTRTPAAPATVAPKTTSPAPAPVISAQPAVAAAPPAAPAPSVPRPRPRGMRPAGDTIPRNPPNGLAFAGSGKYQLYRQGDITWRLNTETGAACILFATDAQWSRTRVFQNGCAYHNDETASLRGN